MAKKKKTRQQKIIADLRRQINASQIKSVPLAVEKKVKEREQPLPLSLDLPNIKPLEKQSWAGTFVNKSYLVKDLKKTAILTTSIIAVQLVLLLILKIHVLVLNGLIY